MSDKKKFVTIFPLTDNSHLTKDVGMIPFFMFKNYGYDSYIATYKNGDYPYLGNVVKGLKLQFIKKYFNFEFLNILIYIVTNSRDIHVLHFFGYSIKNLFLSKIFKILSSADSKTYLKLDSNDTMLQTQYRGFKKIIRNYLVKSVDIISCERKDITSYLNSKLVLGKVVIYLPNGFVTYEAPEIAYKNKKKKFITVARLYDPIKCVPLMLEGFAKYFEKNSNSEWQFQLVGPFDQHLMTFFEGLKKRYKNLDEKIVFTGEIVDKKTLASLYEESIFFVSASLSESFGFVFLEALLHKNFIISTPLQSVYEITDNGAFGETFKMNDADDLCNKIEKCIELQNLEEKMKGVKNYLYDNFYWPLIVEKLESNLKC